MEASGLNSLPAFDSFDELTFANSSESFKIRCAALAFLLGRFFLVAIILLFFNYPTAADNLVIVIEDRRLSGRNRALRFIKCYFRAIVR